MKRSAQLALVVVLASLTSASCELEVPLGRLPPDTRQIRSLSGTGPLDILVVVDNSGSMAEEQAQLARAMYKDECPIQGLNAVPEQLQNPDGELLAELEELCGFAQILAAYERDFRVGVITTDVDACDNFVPDAQGGEAWGFRPQRGCLQPVPSTGQKVITRDDFNITEKFVELIGAIGNYGSPFERGFDAADLFLRGETFVDECEGDLEQLRRPNVDLLIVFVTDEDDCSHSDGAGGFDDETLTTCGRGESLVTEHNPATCYSNLDELVPVSTYADRFRAHAGEGALRVLAVGGAVPSNADDVDAPHAAAGCFVAADGAIDSTCFANGGVSQFNAPGQPCGEDTAADRGGLACCTAEAATRYEDLVAQVDGSIRSICAGEYVSAFSRALE
jgi:hypothetical protein